MNNDRLLYRLALWELCSYIKAIKKHSYLYCTNNMLNNLIQTDVSLLSPICNLYSCQSVTHLVRFRGGGSEPERPVLFGIDAV
jgi:hypothetical protein